MKKVVEYDGCLAFSDACLPYKDPSIAKRITKPGVPRGIKERNRFTSLTSEASDVFALNRRIRQQIETQHRFENIGE